MFVSQDPNFAQRVLVFDADCIVSSGLNVEVVNGVDADLEVGLGYEFIPLDTYRLASATEPPIFEDVFDSSNFTFVEESPNP